MRSLCAVIVSYNSPQNVTACIESVVDQVDKIIVIDNSTDQELRKCAQQLQYPDKISFTYNEENKGLGYALNQGITYSLQNDCAWSLLLDQDSRATPGMLSAMLQAYEKLDEKLQEEVGMVVPKVFDLQFKRMLPSIVTTKVFNKRIKDPQEDSFVHFHITAGSLLKNAIVNEVGLMNQDLFIDYIDFDYCFRLLNKEHKILLCKNAVLHHSLAEKRHKLFFNFREHSYMRVYYQTRNRLFAVFTYGGKYRSFLYSESCRFLSKLLKILVLESDKARKIKMYCRGILDFIKNYRGPTSKLQ